VYNKGKLFVRGRKPKARAIRSIWQKIQTR
jgi:hypothetical protein